MSSLAHELAEQELASAAFAAASEEDASAAFAAAFDTSAAFAAASEEDASASASASVYFDASAAFAVASEEDASAAFAVAFDASAAFAAASEEDARASASASVYFDASAAFAFAAAFLDKEAADAYEAHCRILAKIRQCAKWKASLQARNLRLEMLPGQSPARAGACRRVQARVKVHIDQAKEQAQKLLVLEASAKAEAFFFLHAKKERAGQEARLAAEVGRLQHMVEGQAEYDREAWLLEELELQDVHDDVLRLQEEQEAPKKLKGKKKKKAPTRLLRDEQRAALRRAEAEKLVARLESQRAERAGEEHERTDWRAVAQDDLVDSDGEPCFEDPRRAEWTDLPQDPREAPKDKAVLALRSLMRAGAEPTAEATARVLARELAAATTSGAGLAKSQSKVFDPGGGV